MDLIEKMHKNVTDFLEVYKYLPSEGKAQFEAQLNSYLKDKDEKTQKLFGSLLQAAKDRIGLEKAIEAMKKSQIAF